MTQYTVFDETYVRCGGTVQSAPAGFYEVVDTGGRGHGLKPKTCTTDELILVEGTVADEIFENIDRFMERREEFRRFGLTHKRGYLLHGPGGSGKTSIGMMIAHRFIAKLDGIVVFTPNAESFYHGVSIIREIETGRPSLFLMEEVDGIIGNTSCLSILDGELSLDGAIFVAMTNYKGELPKRVTNRPGRFARVVRIAAPPKGVQVEFLRRLMARAPEAVRNCMTPDAIVEAFSGLHMTMDHLREVFVSHVIFGEPVSVVRGRFTEMASDSDDDGGGSGFGKDDWWEPSDSSDDSVVAFALSSK